MLIEMPGALLLCWAPPAPSADADVTPAKHAREAAAAYRARLAEIAADGPATAGNCAANSDLVFHSWKRFLSRWMGALKAAAQSDGSASQVSYAPPRINCLCIGHVVPSLV